MFKLRFLYALIFFTRFIVDDAGAGGSYYDDIDIDDDIPPAENDNKNPAPSNKDVEKQIEPDENAKKIADLENQLKSQSEYIEKQKNQEAINTAVNDIKSRHNDFDEKAVYEHLKKMNETDPTRANMLNNPIGWENIWYQIRPKTPHNDQVSRSRNAGATNRDEEVFGLVKKGGVTLADEADVIGKYL